MNTTTDLVTIKERPDLFTWGQILKLHTVGDFTVVEYLDRKVLSFPQRTLFHAYHKHNDLHSSHESLEAALIYCIARKKIDNPNDARYMAMAAAKLLETGI
jgi:hypothetical protein